MPRPTRCRRIEQMPVYRSFSPDDVTEAETVRMTVDEYEALRLLDDEGLTQEACAAKMNVARTTVTAIYDSARKKIADTIVRGKRLVIAGGRCEYAPVEIDQPIREKGNDTMRIAVSYENGEIFQHFGHTEQFKLYDIEDGRIAAEQIVNTNESGHGALAGFLKAVKADVLICGGIGGGAQAALQEQGIELCAGANGDADEAVQAYLRGELINTGANCDHHDHHGEGHDCSDHGCGEHECGGHDGGCGGCHSPRMEGPNVGKKVRTHYRGTFNDGTQFDSSYDRGEPLEFVCGAGMMIPGFDKAVADMKVGEIRKVHLMPEEAYGIRDLNNVFTLEIQQLPGSQDLNVGDRAYLQTMDGRPFEVEVIAKDDKNITLDANHEMAGKELNFEIELVEVE